MGGIKTVFDRTGTPIADIRAAVVRSSLLNDVGDATFYVATNSIKCRRELLEYGNYLYIQNDSLPDWVGFIDTPRTWGSNYLQVNAFEVPLILGYRNTNLNQVVTGTPGDLFAALINMANDAEDTLLRLGDVFRGGVSAPETLNGSVFEHMKSIQANSGHNWICTPVIDLNGRLTISISWLQTAGVVTDLELSQGHNILYGDNPMDESGELVNFVNAMSDQQSENPINVNYQDTNSRAAIGLRAVRKSFPTLSEQGSLLAAASKEVTKRSKPDISTPFTVVNVGSTFSNIALGNIVKYTYTNVGFDGSALGASEFVKILGYKFDEAAGTCELFTGKVMQ